MHLSIERLRTFYANLNVKPEALESQKIYCFTKHPLLESCLSSLVPYFRITSYNVCYTKLLRAGLEKNYPY